MPHKPYFLLIVMVTSIAKELSGATNTDDLKRPWNPRKGLLVCFPILGCYADFIYSG